jgi:glucokinase
MSPRRVIGIDAGGTKLLGGVVDEDLVVHHRVHRLWRGAGRQETLDIFIEAVEEVRAAAPDVQAIGFGIPSLVEWETGVSRWSNHLPLADVPFRDLMSERLGLPVVVDNDANMALLAEHRSGAARDARHAVLIALGTGIGSGLLLEGRIYRGATGVGAELGHIVLDLHGPDCPSNCPGRGCLEAFV